MFPKKTLDLIILSILDETPDGLTGYALAKEIKGKLSPFLVPSPGTIYPRSKKLCETGDITLNEKTFIITEQGKKKLTDNIQSIVKISFDFIPKMYKMFMKRLPYENRMNYFGKTHLDIIDDPFIKEDLHSGIGFNRRIAHLNELKRHLEKRREKMLTKIQEIDAKIDQLKEEKNTWKTIPIDG